MKRIDVRLDDNNYALVQFVAQADGIPIASWVTQAILRAAHAHPAVKLHLKQRKIEARSAERERLASAKAIERARIAEIKAELAQAKAAAKAAEKAEAPMRSMLVMFEAWCQAAKTDDPTFRAACLRKANAELPGFAEWYANRNK